MIFLAELRVIVVEIIVVEGELFYLLTIKMNLFLTFRSLHAHAFLKQHECFLQLTQLLFFEDKLLLYGFDLAGNNLVSCYVLIINPNLCCLLRHFGLQIDDPLI